MKLFTFGDSWTEGVGGNIKEEQTTEIPEEKTRIRHKYGWPTQLAKLLKVDLQNDGVGAFSNNAIFNAVNFKLKNQLISSDDFVIIMWSSSLRDGVPFFPNENNLTFWGKRHITKEHLYKYLIDDVRSVRTDFDNIEKDYRDYFINNLFTDTYYDIVNQNYIMYLQFMFKRLGIRYLFCDAFDCMISNTINDNIDKTNLIDKNYYWGFGHKTFKDFLVETNRKDVWQDNQFYTKSIEGKHPNKNGYEIISVELCRFIMKNNLLKNIDIKNLNLI